MCNVTAPGRIVGMAPGSSDMHQPNRKILQIHTNSLFFSYSILKELQKNMSDRPKIMEKFSQPADENGHVLLPGHSVMSLETARSLANAPIVAGAEVAVGTAASPESNLSLAMVGSTGGVCGRWVELNRGENFLHWKANMLPLFR